MNLELFERTTSELNDVNQEVKTVCKNALQEISEVLEKNTTKEYSYLRREAFDNLRSMVKDLRSVIKAVRERNDAASLKIGILDREITKTKVEKDG